MNSDKIAELRAWRKVAAADPELLGAWLEALLAALEDDHVSQHIHLLQPGKPFTGGVRRETR